MAAGCQNVWTPDEWTFHHTLGEKIVYLRLHGVPPEKLAGLPPQVILPIRTVIGMLQKNKANRQAEKVSRTGQIPAGVDFEEMD